MLQPDPTDNFSKTGWTNEKLRKVYRMLEWCSLFTQNQSNLVVFFTSKQLNKGVETQNKE